MHREPDSDAIDAHLRRVAHLLLPMVARYESGEMASTPEGKALLAAPPELRASLAIVALAGPRSGWTAAHLVEVPRSEHWPADLVRALVRRKITWDPGSAHARRRPSAFAIGGSASSACGRARS